MAKIKDSVIRKLALPLEVKIDNDSIINDGFFSLTRKDTSCIIIKSIDEDGYATCEIFPPTRVRDADISVFVSKEVTHIGTEMPQTLGGVEPCQYKYYKQPDGFFYAEVSGKSRTRRLRLGKLSDKHSKISIFAQAIVRNLNGKEFAKKDIVRLAGTYISKRLTSGQILKALLDVLKIEGYLEKREITERKRKCEYYKATKKMFDFVGYGYVPNKRKMSLGLSPNETHANLVER